MKTRLRVLLSAVLVVPLLSMGTIAAAASSSSTDATTNGTSNSSTSSSTSSNTDSTSGDSLTLQQRLDNRKAELKIKLTALQQQRITLKCKASQGLLSRLDGRINGIDTSRTNVYKQVADKLTALDTKVKADGIDTTQLESEIDSFNTQVSTFQTDLSAYKLAVSDLAAMDCVKDPVAFQASLQAARTAHDKTATDALAIRKYVDDTIKPTLQQLRTQVSKEGNS